MRLRPFVLQLALLFFIALPQVRATECTSLRQEIDYFAWPPQFDRISFYSSAAKSALFLSDGDGASWTPLADFIHLQRPDIRIVKTDFNATARYVGQKNFEYVQMDNTKPFPFKDNSFDVIVMRRGLCICNGGKTCGGIIPQYPHTLNFLQEVARVLNKEAPHAIAALQGEHGNTAITIAAWKQAILDVVQRGEVTASIVAGESGPTAGGFGGVILKPKIKTQVPRN